MPALAEQIKAAREASGKTQEEVAKAAGVPLSTYRTYERGTAEPPAKRADAIRDALGILAPAPERESLEDWQARKGIGSASGSPTEADCWAIVYGPGGQKLYGYTPGGGYVVLGTLRLDLATSAG